MIEEPVVEPVAEKAEEKEEVEEVKQEEAPEEPKPEEPVEVAPVKPDTAEVIPKKKEKKEKVPLKPEEPLSKEDLENVLSKLPQTMQEALNEANEEGAYVFRGSAAIDPPDTRQASISRKVFPPAPPTEAELLAAKLEREEKDKKQKAVMEQTSAPASRAVARDAEKKGGALPFAPPGPSPRAPPGRSAHGSSRDDGKSAKDLDKEAKESQKATDKLTKEQAKEVERAQKAEKEAKKEAEKAVKAAEKARAEAEALAAQGRAEKEIFKVENFSPEGFLELRSLPRVIITFNHPLDTKKNSAEPAWLPKVTPAFPAGAWTIEGETSNALVFTPADPLSWPLSTVYSVKITAGALGAQNRPLAQELNFSFTTPTVKLKSISPAHMSSDISIHAPIVLAFDQPIDEALLLQGKHKQIVVKTATGEEIEVELCKDVERLLMLETEHQAKDKYTWFTKEGENCHWLALLPTKIPMPSGMKISVHLATALTSTLGPAKSREPALDLSFNTRPAFTVDSIQVKENNSIAISFSYPLCGPKQTISDITWTPTVTPELPPGEWQLNDSKCIMTYRVDDPLTLALSTAYTISISTSTGAKSWYGQDLEREDDGVGMYSADALQHLPDADEKRVRPATEIFWFTHLTPVNTITEVTPNNNSFVSGNHIWIIETSQPLDPQELAKNINFYIRKSGLVAAVSSLVKKDKPVGQCQVVPWESLDADPKMRKILNSYAWRAFWAPWNDPINHYAFKCSEEFPAGTEIELIVGPRLPSNLGPASAKIERKATYHIPGSTLVMEPAWVHFKSRDQLGKTIAVFNKQNEYAREINHVLGSRWVNATDTTDCFRATCRLPTDTSTPMDEKSRQELQASYQKWKDTHDRLLAEQDAKKTAYQARVKQMRDAVEQNRQAKLDHAKEVRKAIKDGLPMPPPVPPVLGLAAISSGIPVEVLPHLPGDLELLTAEDIMKPFKGFQALRVPFASSVAADARYPLNWTPIITPAPPAGKWVLGTDCASYYYCPTEDWSLSTKYTVSLPADARSYWGTPISVLKNTSMSVSTPCAHVEQFWWPSGSATEQPVLPTMLIAFSQRIDPAKLLPLIKFDVQDVEGVAVSKKQEVGAVLVSESRWKKDDTIVAHVATYAPGKFMLVKPASPLPYRSTIRLDVARGKEKIPSEEGPLAELVGSSQNFVTVPTFECTSYAPTTRPLQGKDAIFLRFNQPLVKIAENMVDGDYKLPWTPTIEPKVAGKWTLQRSSTGRFMPNAIKFVPSESWPRATQYLVSIPKGTPSLVEETLQTDFFRTSSSPVVELVRVWPAEHGFVSRKPLIYLEFDSPVDEKSVLSCATLLSKLQIDGDGAKSLPLEVIPASEALKNVTITHMVKESGALARDGPRTWVVLSPKKALLPYDVVSLSLANLTAASGNLKSTSTYKLKFNVVGTLDCVLSTPVAWRQELPSSVTPLVIQFNQPIVQTPDAIPASFHTRTLPAYALEAGTLPSDDAISSATGVSKVSVKGPTKSSASDVVLPPSPTLELMITDSKASEKTVKLDWIVEDGGKRLTTTAPVDLAPSSTYRLTIPAPITSIFDEKIADSKTFLLRTPTNRIAESWPRPGGIVREVGTQPAILLRFSQPFNPASMIPKIHFFAKKEKSKSIISGLFGKGKKDDKPYCGAVRVNVEDLDPRIDAKIIKAVEEWNELAATAQSLSEEASGKSYIPAPVASDEPVSPRTAEKSKKKEKSKKLPKEGSSAALETPVADAKSYTSPFSHHHWIIVRPERPLPHLTKASLVIGPELPSLLGRGLSAERKLKIRFNVAPQLEVTATWHAANDMVLFHFNQNMFHNGVKLLTPTELPWCPKINVDLPASLYPTWWVVNSTTLRFWAKSLPKSTEYIFTVPENICKSMVGEELKEKFVYKFSTPVISLVAVLPNGSYGQKTTISDPVFGLKFDQHVDPRAITALCQIRIRGAEPYALEPIRFSDALATCKSMSLYQQNAWEVLRPDQLFDFRRGSLGKVVWMRPKNPLPPGSNYKLDIGPNIPSLEGPLVSETQVVHKFKTVQAFEISSASTLHASRLKSIYITFSEPFADGLCVEDEAMQQKLAGCVTFDPPLVVERVSCNYRHMSVYVRSDALNTTKTHTMTIAGWLADQYGQGLCEHIENEEENLKARTRVVVFEPVSFTHNLVADMGSYPKQSSTKLMITYDPMLLYHGNKLGHKPVFRVQNVNYSSLRVCLYKLDPIHDLPKWVKLDRHADLTSKEPMPTGMGTLVSDSVLEVSHFADPSNYGSPATIDIDLTPALENIEELHGQIGLVVMPTKNAIAPNKESSAVCIRAWIQCTRLGAEIMPSPTEIKAWVHDMVDSAPVKAAKVSAIPAIVMSKDDLSKYKELETGSTDKNGWATLVAPNGVVKEDSIPRHILITKGTDSCILLDVSLHRPSDIHFKRQPKLFTQFWDDRGMYRPGEVVHIKGYLRDFRITATGEPSFSVPLLAEGAKAEDDIKNLKWELYDGTNVRVADGSFVLSPVFGTLHVAVPLPENINLGSCYVKFTGLGPIANQEKVDDPLSKRLALSAEHRFVVQEFRRPEFIAKSEILESRPIYLYGEDAIMKVESSYFSGGALADCEVTWKVSSSKANFSAPGWLAYLFSTASDRMELANSDRLERSLYDYSKEFSGITDEKGRHAIKISFKGTPDVCEPVNLVADIEVLDLNKQALTSQQKIIIHPTRVSLGVNLPNGNNLSGTIESPGGVDGKPLPIMLIAADLDGALVPDLPIRVTVFKVLSANKDKKQQQLDSHLISSRAGVPAVFEFDRTKYKASSTTYHEAYALVFSLIDPATSRCSEVVVLLNDPVAVLANSPSYQSSIVVNAPGTQAAPLISPSIRPGYHIHHHGGYRLEDKQEEIVLTAYETVSVETIKLKALQTTHLVGDMARVEITTELPLPAEAIAVVRTNMGNTIFSTHTLNLTDKVSFLEFPVVEENAPWTLLHVSAVSTMVRPGQAEDALEPYRALVQAEGELKLPVTSNHRKLTVLVEPSDPIAAPGSETEVSVRIADWKNTNVTSAEVALVVVDESVLSMTKHEISDPHSYFYDVERVREYIPEVARYSVRKGVQLKNIASVLEDAKNQEIANALLAAAANIDELDDVVPENLVPESEVESEDEIIDPNESDDAENQRAKEGAEDDLDQDEPPLDYDEFPVEEYKHTLSMRDADFGGGGAPVRKTARGRSSKSSVPPTATSAVGGPARPRMMAPSPSQASSPPPPPPAELYRGGGPPPPPGGRGGGPMPPPAPSMQSASNSSFSDNNLLSFSPSAASPLPQSRLSAAPARNKSMMRRSSLNDDNDESSEGEDYEDSDYAEESVASPKGRREMAEKMEVEKEKKSAPAKSKKKMVESRAKSKPSSSRSVAQHSFAKKDKSVHSAESSSAMIGRADMMYDEAEVFDEEDMENGEPRDFKKEEMAPEEVEEEEEEIQELFLRSDFNPLAHFSDAVTVNSEGVAKILVKLPDNLTRYRIWAIAVSQKSSMFGMGESLITASLPLQVRITPPRFMNFNDDGEMPIVIQNLRDKAITVKIGIRAIRAILGTAKPSSNASDSPDSEVSSSKDYNAFTSQDLTCCGFVVEVPANGRRMLSVPIKATKAGQARFQVSVIQGTFGDAQEVKVKVLPPPTTTSFAFSGSLSTTNKSRTAATCVDLRVPADALPDFGSLQISLSTTKLQSLAEPLLYLMNTPHDYMEQRASRTIALAAIGSFLDVSKARQKPAISSDMQYFKQHQQSDGGFRMWSSGNISSPNQLPNQLNRAWLSAQVAQAVAAARAGGFNTHEPLIAVFSKSWTQKLQGCLAELCERPLYSKDHDYAAWATVKCYTIYAFSKLSKDDKKAAKYAETFYNTTSPQTLSIEAIAFLLCVFAEAGHALAAQLANYIETTVRAYNVETRVSYPDVYTDTSRYEIFHSNTRTDAVLLEAMVSAKPNSALVAHLFRGLLRARRDNRWGNTQENAFCIVAIAKYFHVFEAEEPKLQARVWLEKDVCIDEQFVGRSTETRVTEIPMAYVLKNAKGAKIEEIAEDDTSKKKSKQLASGRANDALPGGNNAAVEQSVSESAEVIEESSGDAGEDDMDVEDVRTKGNPAEPLEGKALILHKSGKGRLYYELKVNYSPSSLNVPAADYGFKVSRTYASPTYIADLAAAADIRHMRESGAWEVKKGVKVRVELTLIVFFPTTFVALVDNLPAGFEPVAVDEHPTREKVLPPALSTAAARRGELSEVGVPNQPSDAPVWWQHVNLRDSRVDVLVDRLAPGTYRFAYIARATMAGHFAVPPARAEELYAPSVYGNTESTRVTVF